MFVVSQAALDRSAKVEDRGYYFDFHEFQKNAEKDMTPSTPSIGHIYALKSKLEDIFAEGMQQRFQRHERLAQMTRDWASRNDFTLFPESGYEAQSLTCINNGAKPGGKIVDVATLQKLVREQGIAIDGGYGKIKGTTFRLSNMGDETEESMKHLFSVLDACLAKL